MKKKAVKSTREWFSADIAPIADGNYLFTPRIGCRRVDMVIPVKPDEPVSEEFCHDPNARFVANIGELLLVCGPGVDDIAIVRVCAVKQHGWSEEIRVMLMQGRIDASYAAQILKLRSSSRHAA